MEAEAGLGVCETVLWKAIPSYLRKLNAVRDQRDGKQQSTRQRFDHLFDRAGC